MSGATEPRAGRYHGVIDIYVDAMDAERARERMSAFLTLAYENIDVNKLDHFADVTTDLPIVEEDDRQFDLPLGEGHGGNTARTQS